jgi:hypothetical protein
LVLFAFFRFFFHIFANSAQSKSSAELRELKETATRKVSGVDDSDDIVVDVDYWQSLLPLMDAAIAHAFLREFYHHLLRLRMRHLTAERGSRPIKRERDGGFSPDPYWDEEDAQVALDADEDALALEAARHTVLLQQHEEILANRGRTEPPITIYIESVYFFFGVSSRLLYGFQVIYLFHSYVLDSICF